MKKQGAKWKRAYRRILPTDCPYCVRGHSSSMRIERAHAALSRAQIANRHCETIARSHALMECRQLLIALNRDVEPAQPFSDVLGTVVNVGVQRIESSMRNFEIYAIDLVQRDLDDLLVGYRHI